MREIKFRAWRSSDKTMYGDVVFDDLEVSWFDPQARQDPNDVEPGCWVIIGDREDQGLFPVVVLMQYTGLKDKEGKEIYEGDIVKLYPSDKSGVQILWDEYIAGFGFGNQTMADHLNFRKLATINYEVIGNIYENRELLEAA